MRALHRLLLKNDVDFYWSIVHDDCSAIGGASVARPSANPHNRHWRTWYSMAIWYSIRRQQLLAEPLCRICKTAGRSTIATEVDHVIEHGGDWNAFILGEKQSLCSACHQAKSAQVHRKSQGFDADGEPLDPDHPWNRRQ
jgi:hypothetical protein